MADGDRHPGGRPSSYTDEIANEIIERLMDGESLVSICKSDHMPGRRTVLRWQSENQSFGTECAHAREEQADYMDHQILSVADACTPETAQSDRVKIAAYQWRASKLAPKRYGEKLDMNLSGKVEFRGGLPDLVKRIRDAKNANRSSD